MFSVIIGQLLIMLKSGHLNRVKIVMLSRRDVSFHSTPTLAGGVVCVCGD